MRFKHLMIAIVTALAVGLLCCSCHAPVKKPPLDESKITEENITEDSASKTNPEGQQSTINVPPAPPVENAPPVVDPGSKAPRKFIWDGKKGTRGWKVPSEGSGSVEH